MERRQFGPLGLVSALTLGGGGIGQVWGQTTRDESVATVREAVEAGIAFLDVAPGYGDGEAERVVGEAFAGVLPEGVRVSTKCRLNGPPAADVAGLLENRLTKGRERLEDAREAIMALCEHVAPPRGTTDYLHYFCAENTQDAQAVQVNAPRRVVLYKLTTDLIRAYANVANEMAAAGYDEGEIETIKRETRYYENVRQEVKLASGDYIDLKLYEPAMRHMLDAYIRAEESEIVTTIG